jgi:hypothetical protein
MTNTMQSGAQGGAASDVATTAKDQATEVASSAADEAKVVAHDAAAHARRLVGETRGQLRTQASEQTDRLTQTLKDMSQQLRSMADGNGPASGMVGDLTSQLASTTSKLATRLDEGGLDAALGDVKRFARNRPVLFLAAAAGAGFMAGRLLKAADTHALTEAMKTSDDSGPGTVSGASGAYGQPAMATTPAQGSIGGGNTILASDPVVVEA